VLCRLDAELARLPTAVRSPEIMRDLLLGVEASPIGTSRRGGVNAIGRARRHDPGGPQPGVRGRLADVIAGRRGHAAPVAGPEPQLDEISTAFATAVWRTQHDDDEGA
jgi:hypothetical protein